MSVYIDAQGRLHHDQQQNLAVSCPHCQVLSHITPLAVPQYEQLVTYRPKQVGIVFRCDSCNAPVFLKFNAKMYAASRVELSSTFIELERAKEKFSFTYLPEEAELLFKEALACYSAVCFNAFGSMCRRTAQVVFAELGNTGKLKLFDELNEIRDLGEIDPETFGTVRRVIFGGESDSPSMPEISAYVAGVLLEVMKDLLYQAYVRKGRLQQAMMVRRFFLEETDPNLAAFSKNSA
ncbi:MAG TPA: hypothetical protein VKB41_11835 [Steroidobacteraceae bacterium]|jgi:hypothetical protein|nr:hypothetical protein [Steroidobacteraceae bacterium]